MTTRDPIGYRLDVIEELIRSAREPPGRTALMKCLYILQEVKGLDLGYDFTLYTYGPYDAQVLNDLGYAEALGRVTSRLTTFPNGHQGYLYRAAGNRDTALDDETRTAIQEVATTFGSRSAGELEMVSTILFVDRHHLRAGRKVELDKLVAEVRAIKPHLTDARVRSEIENLRQLGYLKAVA